MNFKKTAIVLLSSLLPSLIWILFIYIKPDISPESCGGGLFLNVRCQIWLEFFFELFGLFIGSVIAFFVLKKTKAALPAAIVILGAIIGYYIVRQSLFFWVAYYPIIFIFAYAISGFIANGIKKMFTKEV